MHKKLEASGFLAFFFFSPNCNICRRCWLHEFKKCRPLEELLSLYLRSCNNEACNLFSLDSANKNTNMQIWLNF